MATLPWPLPGLNRKDRACTQHARQSTRPCARTHMHTLGKSNMGVPTNTTPLPPPPALPPPPPNRRPPSSRTTSSTAVCHHNTPRLLLAPWMHALTDKPSAAGQRGEVRRRHRRLPYRCRRSEVPVKNTHTPRVTTSPAFPPTSVSTAFCRCIRVRRPLPLQDRGGCTLNHRHTPLVHHHCALHYG